MPPLWPTVLRLFLTDATGCLRSLLAVLTLVAAWRLLRAPFHEKPDRAMLVMALLAFLVLTL